MEGNNIGPCLLESLAYASPGVVLRGSGTGIAGFGGTSQSMLSGVPVGDLRLEFWNPELCCCFASLDIGQPFTETMEYAFLKQTNFRVYTLQFKRG